MPSPADELVAKILRLQTQRENLVYALENAELSDQHRAQLQAQLVAVQDELVQLTGGVASN